MLTPLRFAKKVLNLRAYSHCRTHVSFAFTCNSRSRENRAEMPNFFQVWHLSMLSPPCVALICIAMALSQHVSLPNPAADTNTHFLDLPRRLHTPEEATSTGGLLVGEVVESAMGLDPFPTLINIDMRDLERAGALRKEGWATNLWQQLQLALPELRAVRFIPAPQTVLLSLGGHVYTWVGHIEIGGLHHLPHQYLVH